MDLIFLSFSRIPSHLLRFGRVGFWRAFRCFFVLWKSSKKRDVKDPLHTSFWQKEKKIHLHESREVIHGWIALNHLFGFGEGLQNNREIQSILQMVLVSWSVAVQWPVYRCGGTTCAWVLETLCRGGNWWVCFMLGYQQSIVSRLSEDEYQNFISTHKNIHPKRLFRCYKWKILFILLIFILFSSSFYYYYYNDNNYDDDDKTSNLNKQKVAAIKGSERSLASFIFSAMYLNRRLQVA